MSKSHTPAPWTFGGNAQSDLIIRAPIPGRPNDCEYVARVIHGIECIPNGNLIAAAPDMLAALRHVREIIKDGALTGFNCHDGDWAERLFASQAVTSDAVKKATAAPLMVSNDRS